MILPDKLIAESDGTWTDEDHPSDTHNAWDYYVREDKSEIAKLQKSIDEFKELLTRANETIKFLEVSYEKSQQVEKELLSELNAICNFVI